MEVRNVELKDMLEARENRVLLQESIRRQYGGTLISFTMNIAGPVKNSERIRQAFSEGLKSILAQLNARGIRILFHQEICLFTGNEGFIAADGSGEEIKRMMTAIENTHPLGRLFDLDVLDSHGRKIERQEVGEGERHCLICGGPVRICASRRIHSVEELQKATSRMMEQYFADRFAETMAGLATRALLYEVSVSPKPGLVDRFNNGSHGDMNFFTFMNSAAALTPHFREMTKIGMETAKEPPEITFERLKYAGIEAETDMYRATGGINTHKGAIFSLGLLCGAAGRIREKDGRLEADSILEECSAMARDQAERFFAHPDERQKTAGCRFYREYGIRGVRGEAADGFPSVGKTGLPLLRTLLEQGIGEDEAGSTVLLHILAETADTNMIARSDYSTYQQVKAEVRELLTDHPYPDRNTAEELDRAFIRKNLSPGGTADLLAACWFLYFVENDKKMSMIL